MRWLALIVCMACIAMPCKSTSSQDFSGGQSHAELIGFCLNGVRQNSNAIVSGYATFSGRFKADFENAPENDQDGIVTGLLAFESSKIRFDISRPGWVVDKSRKAEFQSESVDNSDPAARRSLVAKMTKGIITKRYSDNGVQVTVWNSDQPMVAIARPADLVDRRFTEYIDYRCPTLFDPFSIAKGWTLEHILTRFDTEFDNSTATVTRQGPVWTLTWRSVDGNEMSRWVLDVDTGSGFAPVRYRCESTRLNDKTRPSKWIPEWENTATYRQVSGVFVPVHVKRIRFMGPHSGIGEEMSLDLNWELINQPVDENVFSYLTFDVPDDVAIQDTSSGETIWIREFPSIDGEATPSDDSSPAIASAFLAVVTIALLSVAALLWRKKASAGHLPT